MGKKTTTLYLETALVERCKELNINISDVVNRTLAILIESPGIHNEEIQLAILKTTKANLLLEIQKCETELKEMQLHLDGLNGKISTVKKEVDEIRRSDIIAGIMRELNERIRTYEYDQHLVWDNCQDLLEKLRDQGLVCTEEWLAKQIERVKHLT